MARPKPTVLVESIDSATYKSEQVLQSEGIYAVYYKRQPINLRTVNTLISYPGPKYKKCSFSAPGHALNLAKKLNALFKTTDFTVHALIAGDEYTGKDVY